MIVSINSGFLMLNILAVILGLVAIAVSVAKSGKNAQAVRAVGVVAIFTMGFWLGLAALAWVVIDFALPHADIKITAKPVAPAKKK